ncbi:MAG: hypothetical protein OJI67_20865 [Prosthecobacter sp.]|nr:hypothetical protein [Prosthecobacter sp.]
MKLIDLLLCYARQFQESAEELKDTVNIKDRGSRLNEMKEYYRLLGVHLEKIQDEHFRKNPAQAVRRAIFREWSRNGYENPHDKSRDETKT